MLLQDDKGGFYQLCSMLPLYCKITMLIFVPTCTDACTGSDVVAMYKIVCASDLLEMRIA